MTTLNEYVTRHCDRCRCSDFLVCLEKLCKCAECACEADGEGIEDITRFALRAWKVKYGGGVEGQKIS